jgi:DNA-binding CsgD family transcriptional regulator
MQQNAADLQVSPAPDVRARPKDANRLDEPTGATEIHAGAAWLAEAARSINLGLSPKERAVLFAAARGAEDKEIAAQLECTLSTVRTLWQRTYKKTRTASRRRLIAALWEKACLLASDHFSSDATVPREPAKVERGDPAVRTDAMTRELRPR